MRHAALALALTLATGCTANLGVPDGAFITCGSSADCPRGKVCSAAGRCADPDDVEAPAELVGGHVAVSPQRGRAGTEFAVTFQASKQLAALPTVLLGTSPQPVALPCASAPGAGANAFRCAYTATGAENGGAGGSLGLDVLLPDPSGELVRRSGAGALDLDFSRPVLAAASAIPADVQLGGVVQLFFTSSEDLGAAPVVVASATLDVPGTDGRHLVPQQQPGTRNYVLTHLVTAADPSGPVTFSVALEDEVGNTSPAEALGAVTIDRDVPSISGLAISPARIDETGTVTATFDATEAAAPGRLTVTVGGRPMACGGYAAGSPRYTCTRAMTGAELPAGTEAAQPVVITLADAAGNATSASGSVVFDFEDPRILSASIGLVPAPTNPLPIVTRATAGTKVMLSVLVSEALDPGVPPAASAVSHDGQTTLPFTYLAASSTPTSCLFALVVPAGTPDGDYQPSITWTDVAGNSTTAQAALPDFTVRTSTPTLLVNQSALVFVRSPLGNAAPEALGTYAVPAGPYFAVEPADPLQGGTTLPGGALLLSGGEVPARVVVQSSGSAGALVLGALERDAAGLFPRKALVSPDVPGVWLVGVDDAGNVSPPVQLQTSEWVATTNLPATGQSPHALRASAYATPSRDQPLAPLALAAADTAGTDAGAAFARSAGVWRDVTWNGSAPSARSEHVMAYDPQRGRVVLAGGHAWAPVAKELGDTWEWDGAGWRLLASEAAGPGVRNSAAAAFDSARGTVVLYGGTRSGTLSDTWVWNGARWTQRAVSGPGARAGHALAYDAARGRVVLYGGWSSPSDTWEFDGTAWAQVATSGPGTRAMTSMAYDAARGRTVLFGGYTGSSYSGETWEWDGATWTRVATTGPAGRYRAAMAYDPVKQRVVLFGGVTSAGNVGDTWEWSGAGWNLVASTGPTARGEAAMAWDATRGRLVLFGGYAGAGLGDTWEWDGSAWARAAQAGPAPRADHALTWDDTRGRVVLHGGYEPYTGFMADTWEWNGAGWAQVNAAGPSGRGRHALAWDAGRGRTVLFGGQDGATIQLADTWEWNGAAWASNAAAGPAGRRYHALTYDAARARTVLFGGQGASGYLADTWTFNGTGWASGATGPAARADHALANDAARGRVVLFGGHAASTFEDTWEWNGAAWAQRATSGPGARDHHAMAFDAARGRTVLYGGAHDFGSASYADTWEWDGASWAQVATAGPGVRQDHAMAYDARHDQVVLFGGVDATQSRDDTWVYTAAAAHQPAIQFEASADALGIPASRVERVQVRAYAGGTSSQAGAQPGVVLWGWATRGAANAPGGWLQLASGSTGLAASAPWLPAAPASLLSWTSPSTAEARRFLVDGLGLAFQVRPPAGAGPSPTGAAVALDYLEVRVRYAAP